LGYEQVGGRIMEAVWAQWTGLQSMNQEQVHCDGRDM
jgi:hypothetical protein